MPAWSRYWLSYFWVVNQWSGVECVWNLMAHSDGREGKWRGNWRMEWVASTLHTTSEQDVSSITNTDAHASAASSWVNWRPRWFKWTHPFRWETKSGFCACAITFQTQSTNLIPLGAKFFMKTLRFSAYCLVCWSLFSFQSFVLKIAKLALEFQII